VTDSVRAFVALPIKGALARRCAEVATALQSHPVAARRGARWTRADGLHATLRFLGEVPVRVLPGVRAALEVAAAAMGRPELLAGPVTALGGRQARVIAVSLTITPPLGPLLEALDHELERLGLRPEGRAFRPHVTLARLRRPGPVDDWLGDVSVGPARALGTEVVLFRSQLSPRGAVYTRLAAAPFGPPEPG